MKLTAEQQQLVVGHLDLPIRCAAPFKRKFPNLKDAIESASLIGLCYAAVRYDVARGEFPPFARQRIFGAIKTELYDWHGFRRLKDAATGKQFRTATIRLTSGWAGVDFEPSDRLASPDAQPPVDAADSFERLLAHVPPVQRSTLRRVYVDDMPMKDIAMVDGVSDSGVYARYYSAVRGIRLSLFSETNMTLPDAQKYVAGGVPYGEVFPHLTPEDQEALRAWYLCSPDLPNRKARVAQPPAVEVAVASGYTGSVCGHCGGARMTRSGPSCEKCLDCGEAGGCG